MPHKDKEQRNAYFRDYRRKHKKIIHDRVAACHRRSRHDRYAKIQQIKEGSPCTDCGRSFAYYVMDFDHRDPSLKVADVSILVKNSTSWDRVLEEIAKCDLVCVNCHRLRTYHGSNSYKTHRYKQHKLVLDELKSTVPCLDCGGHHKPCQMDFDHLHSKVSNVARLVGGPSDKLQNELAKCHLVCANCHRTRGATDARPEAPEHSAMLGALFAQILVRTNLPEDARRASFPLPHLLGVVPDKDLAKMTGVSRPMVAWFRRKAGITMNRKGERVAAL